MIDAPLYNCDDSGISLDFPVNLFNERFKSPGLIQFCQKTWIITSLYCHVYVPSRDTGTIN